jgi:hypothetical protein
MSAGSGASNLGYGNIAPLSNINSNYVNVGNTNNPANFSSNEIPGLPGLAGAKNNVDAAASIVPGTCLFKGGAKHLKRKIKNITKKYKKMKGGSKRRNSLRRSLRAMTKKSSSRRHAKKHNKRHSRRRMRGGYSQYQNNQPFSLSYSVGGILPANQLAFANPPPISVTNTAVDNYNHYTNTGFSSRGH